MDVSVVIPARDAAQTLGRTLACLEAQVAPLPFEVIVVDNGSHDATASIAASSAVVDRVIRRERGASPGPARNAGVESARGALVAFTDADCFPTPGWLAAGIRVAEATPLVQGAVLPDPEAVSGPFDRSVRVTAEHGLYETASLFVAREWFDRVGGFADVGDAETAPFGEDTDFGWRLKRAGAASAFAPEALVHHAVVPRRAAAFVAERRRTEGFPALALRVPELRERVFFGRAFLSRRSAAFDAAVAGVALAVATGRRAPLATTAPYAAMVWSHARHWGPLAHRVAVAEAAADAVGAAGLIRGSLRERSLVL